MCSHRHSRPIRRRSRSAPYSRRVSARVAIAALEIQGFGLQACSGSRRTIVDSASADSITATSSQPGGAGTTMAAAPSDTE